MKLAFNRLEKARPSCRKALCLAIPRPHPRPTHRCDVSRLRAVAWNPARSMPRVASGFFINVSHTKPVRRFSAISIVIPASMPMTYGSYHFFSGLNASTNP